MRSIRGRAARLGRGAPEPQRSFPELLMISISYATYLAFQSRPLTGNLGLQSTRDVRVRSVSGVHSARPFDSGPVMIDPAAPSRKRASMRLTVLGAREISNGAPDISNPGRKSTPTKSPIAIKALCPGRMERDNIPGQLPVCFFYRPKCSALFLRELTGRER